METVFRMLEEEVLSRLAADPPRSRGRKQRKATQRHQPASRETKPRKAKARMPEENESPPIPTDATLPLKHGGHRVNVRKALSSLELLQAYLEVKPQLFYDMLALAQGKTEGVSPRSIALLKEGGILDCQTGAFNDHKDVLLLSAFRQGREGNYLGDPFKAESEQDVQIVRAAEAEWGRRGGGCAAFVDVLRGNPLPRKTVDVLRQLRLKEEEEERKKGEGRSL